MRALIWLGVTSAFAAVNFYAVSQSSDREGDIVYSYDVLASAIVAYGLLLAVVFALTAGMPRRELLALRPPTSWGRAIGLAVSGLVAIFAGATFLLWLTSAGDEQNLAPESWDGSRAGAYAASFVAIVLIGPTVEELLYRGAGVGLLEQYGQPVAIGVTALMFGLGHGLLLSLGAFIWFGVVTAWIRLRTNSLYPALLVHSLFNAFGMIVPLLA
ncbi:MAG TPA: CPBP family intramembrane glutamic endopeptidase [Gaiellaceae bacterium]|nr:CPBP family intramembrane glutamic endopeptidase [Gaiellaceae bacterium]